MTYLIEKDEGVANQRTIHFRAFLSNGTDPDTGLSNDSVIVARGSSTTFTPNALVVATHSAKGMYSIALTASDVSNLGPHAMYYTQGDFPQHIASFCVVNSNPYSNFSNIAAKTYSGVTVGSAATILAGTYSGVTVGVDTIKAATYSGVTVGINNITAGTYSGVTIGGSSFVTINPGTYSNVTVSAGNIAPGTYSGVTVGVNNIAAGTYSGVTVGINNITAGTYSGVTVGSAATILAGTYSGVTVGINNIASGTIQTADFAAAALDATVFSTDAEQAFADRLLLRSIAGGADSGRTVGVALYALRNKVDMSSSIGTVFRVDDTTSAWTFSNTTGAFPISSVGP